MLSETIKQDMTAAPVVENGPDYDPKSNLHVLRQMMTATFAVFCVAISLVLLFGVAMSSGSKAGASQTAVSDVTIMDKYDMYITNEISNALDGVLSIKKVYWLSDSEQVAPEPDPTGYGTADSPAELAGLLEEAKDLLGDQEMVFNMDTPVLEGQKIHYYYDETILVVIWKQLIDRSLYTCAEVKIADASQFRRFLAGGEFGSDKQYVTTEMAASVNAVVASSGDFYKFRHYGVVVYDRQVQRFEGHYVDTCYIDDNGDLLFTYRDEIPTREDAEKYVKDNNVRFSLAFGPVLIDNGQNVAPASYSLGETNEEYSRAALCQVDDLHYMFINISQDAGFGRRQTIQNFAKHIAENFPCQKAYALDGGQTTAITLGDALVTRPDFGTQRRISDIIYFATALPDGE